MKASDIGLEDTILTWACLQRNISFITGEFWIKKQSNLWRK